MAVVICTIIFMLSINIKPMFCDSWNEPVDEEKIYFEKPEPCIIPPDPANGKFTPVDPSHRLRPGTVVPRYIMTATCSSGFTLVGPIGFKCNAGLEYDEIPKCVRNCHRDFKNARLVTCSAYTYEDSQCFYNSPGDQLDTISDRSNKPSLNDELVNNCTRQSRSSRSVYPDGIQPVFAEVQPAVRKDTPWHVGVYTKTTRPYKNICGGSVISSLVVISAAHCFWSDVHKQLPASKFAVAAGKLYKPWNDIRDEYAQKIDVVSIRIPPRYQGITTHFQSDLALLAVAAPFRYEHYVHPVCLDFNYNRDEYDLRKGNLGKVSGWGLVGEDGQQVAELQVGELPVVGIDDCIAGVSAHFRSYITSDKICAGYTNGTALCKGDSGGGLAFHRALAAYNLRGVVSAAPRVDKPCNVHSWATFTHVAAHERFIMSVLSEVHG